MIQDKGKLFCSSDDLFASFENETPYCTIVGMWTCRSTIKLLCVLDVLNPLVVIFDVHGIT